MRTRISGNYTDIPENTWSADTNSREQWKIIYDNPCKLSATLSKLISVSRSKRMKATGKCRIETLFFTVPSLLLYADFFGICRTQMVAKAGYHPVGAGDSYRFVARKAQANRKKK